MTSYSFHSLAELELVEAARFYEARRAGLGHSFLAAVHKAIQHIQANPESSPLAYAGLRRKALSQFPYSLIYGHEAETIVIFAVMHEKRRPAYWKGRI